MNIRRIFVCIVLIFAICSLGVVACSQKKVNYESQVQEYVQNVSEDFFDEFEVNVVNNSSTQIFFPEMTSEQKELAAYAYKNVTIEIGDITVDTSDNTAEVNIIYHDVKEYSDDYTVIATMEEYKEVVDSIEPSDIEILLIVNIDDDTCVFNDLNEVVNMFYDSYCNLCFLDDNNQPINTTTAYTQYIKAYYNEVIIGNYWYDPIFANPLEVNQVTEPKYLQIMFYFDELVTGDFEAELRLDDQMIDSATVHIEDEIFLLFDFVNEDVFEPGSYTVILKYNGFTIKVSDTMTVE